MRPHWILCLVFAVSSSAFGGQRVTVQELTQKLISLHDAGKSDEDVAGSLEQLQLSEEMSAGQAADLEQYLPGSLSLDQLAVLRGLSEFEAAAPPPAPAPPAPDAAALLTRTATWVTTAYGQTPNFTVSKVVDIYRADTQSMSKSSGAQADVVTKYGRPSEERTDTIVISQGVEKATSPGPKVKWGENGEISEGGPQPSLAELFQEASASGKLAFSRWETIDGKPAAVFSFAVDKKKSHYTVDYCCFSASEMQSAGVGSGGEADITPGANMTSTSWKPFLKVVPFHGLLCINPDSGAIVRTVTFAELKPFDFVHAEQVRIDYATQSLGDKSGVVPVRKVTLNETVPGADTRPESYPIRRELITAEYANYRVAAQ